VVGEVYTYFALGASAKDGATQELWWWSVPPGYRLWRPGGTGSTLAHRFGVLP